MTRHLVIAFLLAATASAGAEPSKEECIDAHGRGQDAKEQGKLTLARKLFLSCAQSACPQLVASDCAKFADDLGRLQPTVMFAARDGSGSDLPDTTVYVDDMLVVTRLDDGKPHDIDPGKHNVKFVNAGHDQTVTVVVGAGEQGRTVVATFGDAPHVQASAPTGAKPLDLHSTKHEPKTTHPTGATALVVGGLIVTVGGAALGTFELTRVPANCSVSTHECAAAPGDQVFADAQHAMTMANIGWIATGVGLAATIGGAIWWVNGATKEAPKERFTIAPWINSAGGGFAISGAM